MWQDARAFTGFIYQMTAMSRFKRGFGQKDQIQRAAVLVMSNIAGGYERDNNTEFVRFLRYCKESIGEVSSLLCVAFDLSYLLKDEFLRAEESAISK